MLIKSSVTQDDNQDSAITAIEHEFDVIDPWISSSLFTIERALLKKMVGKE